MNFFYFECSTLTSSSFCSIVFFTVSVSSTHTPRTILFELIGFVSHRKVSFFSSENTEIHSSESPPKIRLNTHKTVHLKSADSVARRTTTSHSVKNVPRTERPAGAALGPRYLLRVDSGHLPLSYQFDWPPYRRSRVREGCESAFSGQLNLGFSDLRIIWRFFYFCLVYSMHFIEKSCIFGRASVTSLENSFP